MSTKKNKKANRISRIRNSVLPSANLLISQHSYVFVASKATTNLVSQTLSSITNYLFNKNKAKVIAPNGAQTLAFSYPDQPSRLDTIYFYYND
jgi:RNase P protein component